MLKDIQSLPEWREACLRYRYDILRFAIEGLGMTEKNGQAVTWQQRQLFVSVARNGSRTSVASGHGCFGRDTSMYMADGTHKKVQHIAVGDWLLGNDGKSKRLVKELIRGKEDLYKLTYSNGESHTFNASHILCIKGATARTGYKKRTIVLSEWLKWSDKKKSQYYFYKTSEDFRTLQFKIQKIECLGIGCYYGFILDGNHKFLDSNRNVLHNTGKTRSAGIIALWHLLFFEHSVMMFTAPQIDQLRKLVWKEISICVGMLKKTHLSWLADYVVILAESVYIKGHDKTWHVIAKTAPKNKPNNIAGQHGDNYFLWGDEACGIDDSIMAVAMGALTHKNNRACLTSQPALANGFFFDTHHRLSIAMGGVWNNLTFSSELSPIVSKATLKESYKAYGSREDAQYMVRVRGLFPDRANEFLITRGMAVAMYDGKKSIRKKHTGYGYIASVDVGGGVGRDDSVITIAKVWGDASYGDYARRVEIIDIPLCSNRADIHELTAVIEQCLLRYSNLSIVLDANGAGIGLGQNLKSRGIHYKEVNWGNECFEEENKKLYTNKRSQANVCLKRGVEQGRVKIICRRYRAKLEEQIARIPYVFDERSRYKILSKEEMRRKGYKSPDMIDTLAFLFMEGVYFVEANDAMDEDDGITIESQVMEDLEALAGEID